MRHYILSFLIVVVFPVSSLAGWADATPLRIESPSVTLFETRRIPAFLCTSSLERSETVNRICKDSKLNSQTFISEFIDFLGERMDMRLERTSDHPEEQYTFTHCGSSTLWQLTGNRWKSLNQIKLITIFDVARRTLDQLYDNYCAYLNERLELKTLSRIVPAPETMYSHPTKSFDVHLTSVAYTQSRRALTADEIVEVEKQVEGHRAQLVALAGSDAVDQLDVRLDSILERHPAVRESETKTTGVAD